LFLGRAYLGISNSRFSLKHKLKKAGERLMREILITGAKRKARLDCFKARVKRGRSLSFRIQRPNRRLGRELTSTCLTMRITKATGIVVSVSTVPIGLP